MPIHHGTNSSYQSGCRCDACRQAHAEYARAYHIRNRDRDNARSRKQWQENGEEMRARDRARYPRRRDKLLAYQRLTRYGLTVEAFGALLASQDGCCAICRTDIPLGRGDWHVDHDHATGAIRGLLCHACNVALGNFADSPERLRAALRYLEESVGPQA